MARRGPRGRTHFAGTRRTFPGTSQGVRWGPATPLGEVDWTGTRGWRVDSDKALGSFYLTLCMASLFFAGNRFGF